MSSPLICSRPSAVSADPRGFPLVVAHVLASGDRQAVRTAVAVRVGVVKRGVGLRLGFDDMGGLVAVDASQRLADGRAAEAVARLGHRIAADAPCVFAVDILIVILVGQRQHLVGVERVGEVGRPAEVLGADVHRRNFEFEPVEADRTDVLHGRAVSRRIGQRDVEEQVFRLLAVIVGGHAQAVVEERHVETDVELLGLLPRQAEVGQRRSERSARTGIDARHAVSTERVVIIDVVVTRQTVAQAEFQLVELLDVPELLLGNDPAGRNSGEIAPAVILGEERRTVGAHGEAQHVFLLVVVVQTSEIGDLAPRRLGVGPCGRRGARPSVGVLSDSAPCTVIDMPLILRLRKSYPAMALRLWSPKDLL